MLPGVLMRISLAWALAPRMNAGMAIAAVVVASIALRLIRIRLDDRVFMALLPAVVGRGGAWSAFHAHAPLNDPSARRCGQAMLTIEPADFVGGAPRGDCGIMPTERHDLICAMATPLRADLTCDAALLLAHGRDLLARGCDGLAVLGTTGEGPCFDVAQRCALLESLLRRGSRLRT